MLDIGISKSFDINDFSVCETATQFDFWEQENKNPSFCPMTTFVDFNTTIGCIYLRDTILLSKILCPLQKEVSIAM